MVHSKIEKLLELPQHEQRSPEWFALRYTKLTSSDAATVLGINPYSKPHELLFKKCGYDPKPFISNVATLHGQKYEDTAIELYCRITGKVNFNFGCICYSDVNKEFNHYNSNNDFLAGSPDGIVESLHNIDEEPILIEVKCPYRRPIKDGYIPAYYYPQVQLNLYICDLNIADFIEFCPKTNKLNVVRIVKDMKWINENLPTLIEFWENVKYYREIGIENQPEYIKKKQREEKREQNKKEKLEKTVKSNNFKKSISVEENIEMEEEMEEENKKRKCMIVD
jgi:putative phage-type endonuclease